MQSDPNSADFLLFPSRSNNAKMMAVESSRHHQGPYFQDFSIDPALVDSFSFNVDNLGAYGHHDPGLTQASYQNAGFGDSYPEMAKSNGFPLMPTTPPAVPISNSEPYMSGVSTASGPSIASASSSAMGSPYSANAQNFQEEWVDTNHGLGLPGAVMGDLFPNENMVNTFDSEGFYQKKSDSFVDPSLIQPMQQQPQLTLTPPAISYPEQSDYTLAPNGFYPQSPEPSQFHHAESYMLKQSFSQQSNLVPPSPIPSGPHSRPVSIYDRRSSISSIHSRPSQASPGASGNELDDDTKEKGRCPHPDCGRVFKDLKAHMLTHQSERPEKCPIVTCEYHTKGFARKYDKNRHTLTHYKGTMVCGFCPGSGSPAEKSFNRADVFKRHLTSVHGVEQTPPNCRKRSPAASSNKSVSDYCQDATGKCSTCSGTFNNAQDFYEHLDDCVLRVVQQEEPSEAINQQRLAEVESDEEVKKTMEKHKLLDTAGSVDRYDENDDDDDDYDDQRPAKGTAKAGKGSRVILGNNNAVSKYSSNANNKGRITASKRRSNRDRYPQSWGCPSNNIKMKKRVLCVFDGQRRLWKDEMMLDNEFEVRLKLPGGAGDGTNREAYITDLDVETLKRANGILSASEEERGAWVDGPSGQLIGQPAMLLPDFSQNHEAENVDIDELMS